MFAYVIRRVLATIPVMLVVALFVFSLLYLAPGDPAAIIAGDQATPADVDRIRASLGLDRPFVVRFGEWLWQIISRRSRHLDLHQPAGQPHDRAAHRADAVADAADRSCSPSCVAIPLGVLAAWKHGTWIDRAVMVLAVFGFSMPVFVLGYLLAYVFALQLDWLPVQGFTAFSDGLLAVPAQPDPADRRARPDLHRADRPHHPRDACWRC